MVGLFFITTEAPPVEGGGGGQPVVNLTPTTKKRNYSQHGGYQKRGKRGERQRHTEGKRGHRPEQRVGLRSPKLAPMRQFGEEKEKGKSPLSTGEIFRGRWGSSWDHWKRTLERSWDTTTFPGWPFEKEMESTVLQNSVNSQKASSRTSGRRGISTPDNQKKKVRDRREGLSLLKTQEGTQKEKRLVTSPDRYGRGVQRGVPQGWKLQKLRKDGAHYNPGESKKKKPPRRCRRVGARGKLKWSSGGG